MISRITIRSDKFAGCEALQYPLNDALNKIYDYLATLDALAKVRVVTVPSFRVDSNDPTKQPWPIRLPQIDSGAALLLRAERIDHKESPSVAPAITHQRIANSTLFLDFISGLTVGGVYRLDIGVVDGT